MKTLKKRIVSGAMAGVLALSLAVPAFADDSTPSKPNTSTVITGTYEEADIAVTVPTTVTAVINPYGLGMTVTDSNDAKVSLTGQIVSVPQAITNESGLDLNVGATVTGEIPLAEGVSSTNAMKFATATTKGVNVNNPDADDYVAPATAKSAYVNLQVVQAPAAVAGADKDELGDKIITAAAADATWKDAESVTVGTKAVTVNELAVLKAANMDTDGNFESYPAGSAVLFRLTGDCVVSPKVAWAETDTFNVTVAFTFTPATAE